MKSRNEMIMNLKEDDDEYEMTYTKRKRRH